MIGGRPQICNRILYRNHACPFTTIRYRSRSAPRTTRAATPSHYLSDLIVCCQIAFKTLVESLGVLLNPLARSTWVTPNLGA